MKSHKSEEPVKIKIDRKLNLVIPIDTDRGTSYVHVMPISREVFEQNFLFLGRAYAAMFAELGTVGPRLAMLIVKRVATEMEIWEEVENSLIAEMRRLSNVLAPAPAGRTGYEMIPWQQAIERKIFDEEDVRGVENILVFFMLTWHMSKRQELPMILEMAIGLGAQLSTSLTPMAFADSLKTSTGHAPSISKTIRSSVPS